MYYLVLFVLMGGSTPAMLESKDVYEDKIACERVLHNSLTEWRVALEENGHTLSSYGCYTEDELFEE